MKETTPHIEIILHALTRSRKATMIVQTISTLYTVFRYCWAAPNTGLGLSLGLIGLASGGRIQVRRNCVEFFGGWLEPILDRCPPGGARAMTLGHTIVGVDAASLDCCRDHEHVHVRQYERWGPFFLPAYLSCSAYLWLCKRDYYRENPFEVEAYSHDKG